MKINGTYLGRIDGFERFCELSARDEPLCELQPPESGFLPVVFLFNEELLRRPPRGASVCILPDGVAVYAHTFYRHAPSFTLIAQKNCPAGEITVFSQGIPQALFRGEKGERTIPLSEDFSTCSVYGGKHTVLLAGKNELCALDRNGEFFRGEGKSEGFDEERDELRVVAPLKDFCGRTAKCTWEYDEARGESVLKSCEVSEGKLPPPQFMLCVLAQNLLLGLNVRDLLSDELFAAQADLKDYFGEYVKVTVPPQMPFGAGMVCPKGKDIYEMKYFSADVENGKIVNIQRTY